MKGGLGRPWQPSEDDILVADTKAGVPRKDTAAKLKRTPQAVRSRCHIKKFGRAPIGTRCKGMTPEQLGRAVQMRLQGVTYRAIASTFGVKSVGSLHETIARYLKRHGPPKPPAEGPAPCVT